MVRKISIGRFNFLSSIVVLSLLVLSIGVICIVNEYKQMQLECRRFEEDFIHARQEEIAREVRDCIDFIDYMKAQTENRVERQLIARISRAHELAEHLWLTFHNIKSTIEIKQIIWECLSSPRFNDGKDYFFVLAADGSELRFPHRPDFIGRALDDIQDAKARQIGWDLIEIATSIQEGMYYNRGPKPDVPGRNYPKITYVKHFAPIDWVIGTSTYLDDMEKKIKAEVLRRIQHIRLAEDQYLFVLDFNGNMLSHPDPSLIGRNIIDMADPSGFPIIRELIRAARRPAGGFVRYGWQKPQSDAVTGKMSYALSFPEWKWLVATGIHLDDMDREIAERTLLFRQGMQRQITSILFLFTVAILVVVMIARFFSRKLQLATETFIRFFAESSNSYQTISSETLVFREFKTLARFANRMARRQMQAEKDLKESRRKLETLLGNLPGMAYRRLNDADGTFEFVSQGGANLTGYHPGELADNGGISYGCLIHNMDRDDVWNRIRDALAAGKSYRIVYRIRTKSGGEKWVWEQGGAVAPATGEPDVLEGLIVDISDRKAVEDQLRESEERFRAIFETAEDAIFLKNKERQYTLVNPSMKRLFGVGASEIIGRTTADYFDGELDNQFREQDLRALRGEIVDQEISFSVNGSYRTFQTILVPMHDDRGEITGLCGISRDVTETRLLEARLRQGQKMEALGTLAGGIAHDFNNILGAIMGYTEVALLKTTDPGLQKNLNLVIGAADRAKELIWQILTFSRKNDLELKPVQMDTIVREALRLLRASLPSTIEIQQDFQSTGRILADPTQIHQILMNLCTNAAQAMNSSGGALFVGIRDIAAGPKTAADYPGMNPGPHIQLTVRDTGHGMSPDVMERIFDPFFTTKNRGEGTGMGLSVVHGIVTRCGGTITVASEPGLGTAFDLFFPRVDCGNPAESTPPAELPEGNEAVLFIDDEKDLTQAGREMLELLGYHVTAMTCCVSALKLFQSAPNLFDVVITDQTMPQMTGLELAEKMMSIRPDMPIILCSGDSSRIDEEKRRTSGIRFLLKKPLHLHSLAVSIRHAIDRN